MLRPYRTVLALPGALSFAAAGFVARLPISMEGIGIVLLVQSTTGRYADAGLVTALYALAGAVMAPQLGRLIDRFGQRRVLVPAMSLHLAGLVLLVLAAQLQLPLAAVAAASALTGGAMPSIGSCVRARWSQLVGGTPMLHTAFSFEAVADELIFIVGPVVVTLLATSVDPVVALAVPFTAGGLGTAWFVSLRGTEPPAAGRASSGLGGVLQVRGLLVVSAIFLALGTVFGTFDVVVVAFTDQAGQRSAAGLVLALFATGSMLSGLLYGARAFRSALHRRFVVGVLVFAVGTAPLNVVPGVLGLAVAGFAMGLAISPTLIPGNALAEHLAPSGRLTEALTWLLTALLVGVAGGSSLAGVIVDAHGAQRGFLVASAAGLVAATLALGFRRALTGSAHDRSLQVA